MSIEAGEAEGMGPPDSLPEDSTSKETAEAVYRRERELESASSKQAAPTAEVLIIEPGNRGSDAGGSVDGRSDNLSGQQQEESRMEEEEEDILERARRYIAKKKEDVKAHIRAMFADKINT